MGREIRPKNGILAPYQLPVVLIAAADNAEKSFVYQGSRFYRLYAVQVASDTISRTIKSIKRILW